MLDNLGLNDEIRNSFEPYSARELALARVLYRDRERCRVMTAAAELPAEIGGALWYRSASEAELPAVGDWVAVRVPASGAALVEAVLPRRTRFSRRAAGRRESEQVVAANVDLVFLVMGLDGDFNLRRLERYLALAVESGAGAVVVLNKADLCEQPEERAAEARAAARGVPVEIVSAAGGHIDPVRRRLAPGRTIALLGSSGVGKSTIVNALLGAERQQVSAVRESDDRGRHTTTFRELIPLAGGCALIDTPGMRELQLWAESESIGRVFEEIEEAAQECRFRDCSHQGEAGCAVAQALLDGRISGERWESYRKLLGEARHHEMKIDASARQREKQKWKTIHKAQREISRRRARD